MRGKHHYSSSHDSDSSSISSSSISNTESSEDEPKDKIESFYVIYHQDVNKYDLRKIVQVMLMNTFQISF